MPNVDDGPEMMLAFFMVIAVGVEIDSQERLQSLRDDARVYVGAGCGVDEARTAMRQTYFRSDN